MRKKFIYSIIGILACAYTYAQSFCSQVQPVGTYYEDTIKSPGTYYFSAQTFDLPLDVSFTSLDPNCSEAPQIWADLTCTPGYYSDPNIRDLVNDTTLTNKYNISIPMSVKCQTDTVDGHYVHHLKLGKSYRNRLKLVGINYDVPAYVKVELPCAGIAHMEQDTSSQACINDARRFALPDSARALANDSLTTFIFPFKDWKKIADSVALYWNGPEPAHIWMAANNCEFEINDIVHTWYNFIIQSNGEHILDDELLKLGLSEVQDTTGFLFVKIISAEDGRLFTRPLTPDYKGATLFRMDTPQEVTVADDVFYCFLKEWKSVEWIANTRKIVKMYLHTSPEEAPIDSFKFDLQDSTRRVLQWSESQMGILRAKTKDPLLFVRFECSRESFVVTPQAFSSSSSCVESSIRLRFGSTLPAGKTRIFGLFYEDIEGYPLEINCVNSNSVDLQNIFIADTCDFLLRWNQASTKARCVYYKKTGDGGGVYTIDSATIAGWKPRITPEGYLYLRTTADGTITFTTTKPEEQDPEGEDPEYPEIPTGMDNSSPERDYQKILHNGQIFIIRAGKTYTITGQVVKIE